MLGTFASGRLDDRGTLEEIRRIYFETGELVDPHTAVGVAAARARRRDPAIPMISLATAHPAKFPDAVEQATGIRPELPPRLADLYDRTEKMTDLPNNIDEVARHIRAAVGATRAA